MNRLLHRPLVYCLLELLIMWMGLGTDQVKYWQHKGIHIALHILRMLLSKKVFFIVILQGGNQSLVMSNNVLKFTQYVLGSVFDPRSSSYKSGLHSLPVFMGCIEIFFFSSILPPCYIAYHITPWPHCSSRGLLSPVLLSCIDKPFSFSGYSPNLSTVSLLSLAKEGFQPIKWHLPKLFFGYSAESQLPHFTGFLFTHTHSSPSLCCWDLLGRGLRTPNH